MVLPRIVLADWVAGISVACILLPEAIAYAAIAHLDVQHALIAVLVGLVAYAWLGGSPFAITAPTSSAAALLAAVVMSLKPSDALATSQLSFALVILTGGILMILAKVNLGRLAAFVSRPVLHGFAFALAITIIIKQLPILFAIPVNGANPVHVLLSLLHHVQEGSVTSALIGCTALLLLRILRRWPKVPGALVVLLAGVVLTHALPLVAAHVALVGSIHMFLPRPSLPDVSTTHWLELAELTYGLLIIIVAESWGSIRSLALKHGQLVEPNRELYALGVANLLSGLLQGLPVGAGFSACSANEQAGAYSKAAGAVAAGILLLIMLFAQSWVADIPEPIVAAAVINALSHALTPRALIALWRMQRDQYLAIAVIFAVLAFGVLHGMLIGVGLSLAAALRTFSLPVVRELAELGNSRDYIDLENHPSAKPHTRILILRPEVPLFFANVEGVLAEVLRRFAIDKTQHTLIISLEESADLDSTAADCLVELSELLQRQQKCLLLARVKDPIQQLLLQHAPTQFQQKLFWSVADAVHAAQQSLSQSPC